jgi:streptomycin 6-kinase
MKRMSNDLDHYLEAWHLADPQPLATTHTSHIYTVTSEGTRVVLKLLTEIGAEERQGAAALRYFDGHGAVRLLREDDYAHLLEYAHGDNLAGIARDGNDDQATAIISDVLNKLHEPNNQPIPDKIVPLKRWFRDLFQKAEQDKNAGINSVFVRAAPLAEHLLDQNREVRVLHGDIHHENIRFHPQRGWLAFDPKGLVGERTFDAANTLCNPLNAPDLVENEARILGTTRILAEKMGIEQPRVLAFVYIYCCLSASWSISGGEDGSGALKIAALVEPHIAHLSF